MRKKIAKVFNIIGNVNEKSSRLREQRQCGRQREQGQCVCLDEWVTVRSFHQSVTHPHHLRFLLLRWLCTHVCAFVGKKERWMVFVCVLVFVSRRNRGFHQLLRCVCVATVT